MAYMNIAEVETAASDLAAAYPSICTLIALPNTTFETRTVHALRLGGGAAGSRDCVMIICGVHAREWGSCEIAINLAADLLEAYDGAMGLAYGGKSFTSGQIKFILDNLHLLIIPLVNPDGRNYSQTSAEPLWRRNRNPANAGGQASCIGVDVNRNFDFLFDFPTAFSPASEASTYTSTDPCNTNQVYHGPSPFSEPESSNVKWLLDTNPRTRWFLDVHSYSEDILYSWGNDDNQTTDPSMNFRNPAFDGKRGVPGDAAYNEFIPKTDLDVASKLAFVFRDALQLVRGKNYLAAPSFGGLYPTSGASDDYSYSRHFVDPSKGKIYAYTIEWGKDFQPAWSEMAKIVEDVTAGLIAFCAAAPCAAGLVSVGLTTPSLDFHNVPAGVETTRAAIFSVQTCSAVDFTVTPPSVDTGPGAFNLPIGGNASLPAASNAAERLVYVWVSYQGTSPGDVTTGHMNIHCAQTGDNFVIPITANTIDQPKVASILVLDKSGSMDFPSGIPGMNRIDVLHAAAPGFPALLPDPDGIGIVAFDTDANLVMDVKNAGLGGRTDAIANIGLHLTNPAGLTAIGDGVVLAHDTLQPLGGYAHKNIVVFTDGEETADQYIDDVKGIINDRVFAIGLGTVQEVNPVALSALVNNTGGYLLLTDALGQNDTFRLAKYFVQILAGATNAEVVVDPEGLVFAGTEARIPFDVTEADYGIDAIVLSPTPGALDFRLETPDGAIIDHGANHHAFAHLAYYRIAAQRGRWHILLRLSKQAGEAGRRGIPYSAVVHARSNLKLGAYLTQPSLEPGTTLELRAVLTEIDLPVDHRAQVHADVRRPDGTSITLALPETEPGIFETKTPAPLAGVYPVRFRASGQTLRGLPFQREQTRTGLAWHGGDDPPPRRRPTSGYCDFLRCLLADDSVRRWLEKEQIDLRRIEECLKKTCR